MKYTDLLQKLQKENEGHIVIMQSGIFFISVGKDALELNKLLGLKLTCMKEGMCKVRFSNKIYRKIYKQIRRFKNIFYYIYI